MSNQWKITRLRFLLSTPLSYGATESGYDFDSELPRYIRITDIRADGSLDPENAVSLPHDIAEPYLLKNRDILLARSGATVGKAFLYRANGGEACFAGYLIRARCDQRRILPEYLSYFFQSGSYWRFIKKSALQATIQNVCAELYKEVPVTHPTIKTQKIIIHYLDQQTAKIDRLMDLRRRQIALLKEQRAALIQQAVTRGLNPNVPMKDSGLPWLGEIPAHWKITVLKWQFQIASGSSLPIEDLLNESDGLYKVPVIGGNGVLGFTKNFNISTKVLAIGRVGALCGNVHFVSPPAWITDNALMVFNIRNYLSEYLCMLLTAMNLNRLANQNAQPLITGTLVKNQRVPLPSLDEQHGILAFVKEQNAKFDALHSAYSRQLTLLAEYRAALIHECVTGRRPVPDDFNPGVYEND